MSSIATIAHLRRATSQLPVSWYCDPAIYAAEQRLLFARAPSYVGHELMVPNVGDYCALESRDNAQALVRNPEGIELVSNICRHRQAIMLKGRGNARQHRLSDPPLDLRSQGRAPRRAALRRQPVPRTSAARRSRTGTASCSTASATSIATSRRSASHDLRLLEPRARPDRDPRVQLQLEDLHRGLPRGLPRRAVPSGPRPVRHVRRPEVGVRRLVLGADGRREERLAKPGIDDLRALAQGRGRLLSRRDCRRTARSGWSTTRTSCSSGIRTC